MFSINTVWNQRRSVGFRTPQVGTLFGSATGSTRFFRFSKFWKQIYHTQQTPTGTHPRSNPRERYGIRQFSGSFAMSNLSGV